MKTDLPVLILREILLLPNNEMKIEFNNDSSKNIIDISELFHNNNVFVVSINSKDESFDTQNLPKIGVIAKFENKIVLPDGRVRIILKTVSRAVVHEYLNHSNEMLEAIISKCKEKIIEDELLYKKIFKEISIFSKTVPALGNVLLPRIKGIKDLSSLTDIVAQILSQNYNKLNNYLNTLDVKKRTEMLLSDIYNEQQLLNFERKIDEKVKKNMDNSQREFILKEKIKALKQELGEDSVDDEIANLKEKINNLNCQIKVKEKLNKELKKYQELPSTSPEVGIIKNYIEYLLELPWRNKTKDNIDLIKAQEILNNSHYGIEKAKTRIIEYLAVKKVTKKLSGTIICLVGPPGVGKTTLVSSIAQAMNRKFVKISLGGVNDTAEIIGHRRTYIGARPGRIISAMKKSESNNPVFLIDEIDKLSKSINGDPASALLEVLDIEQNKHFVDNYIEEEFDLSNVLFILTANYIENIPPALKDRLEIVELYGYTELEKLSIAKEYLIPKLCQKNGLPKLSIKDKEILYVIRNYTRESGVRDLKRKLDQIIRKIVTKQLIEKQIIKNVRINDIEEFLGTTIVVPIIPNNVGVANGLAFTTFGGELLPIEVTYYKGNGELILTGSLGEVMKESAYIALSYIKTNYEFFKLDYQKIVESDIHIHVPEGAIPKDGPSAGITLTSALISAFSNRKLNNKIAMTGEITLHGDILPIGGLKEKSIGALRNNIEKILIPYDNYKEIKKFPDEIKNNIEFISVKNYKEAYKYIFMEKQNDE